MQFFTGLFPKATSSRVKERSKADIKVVEYYAMLIISFDINNVQNPLQRKYRRGQTVLSLDQNLLVGKWNKKKMFFVKMIP